MSGIIEKWLKEWARTGIVDMFWNFPTIYKKVDAEWRRLAGGLAIVHSRTEEKRPLSKQLRGRDRAVRK